MAVLQEAEISGLQAYEKPPGLSPAGKRATGSPRLA